MTAIVTITLNPAVDLSTWVEKILPIFKLRCTSPHRNPGGGGINVARVIRRFGADVTAIYPIGGRTGDLLRKLLDAEAVVSRTFPILGETREDFFVGETSTSQIIATLRRRLFI
jgi:6-phosphofructokinase 2